MSMDSKLVCATRAVFQKGCQFGNDISACGEVRPIGQEKLNMTCTLSSISSLS